MLSQSADKQNAREWRLKVDRVDTHVYRIKRAVVDKTYSLIIKKATRKDREWLKDLTIKM